MLLEIPYPHIDPVAIDLPGPLDVRWYGRECILRAVVVRRLLSEAGYRATVGNSIDGRNWELTVGPVPADEVASVIENYIW